MPHLHEHIVPPVMRNRALLHILPNWKFRILALISVFLKSWTD